MTRFIDGPAAGQRLNLTRTPPFLRVTFDPHHKLGALSDPEAEPPRGGRVYAYRRLQAKPANGRAHYKLCTPQPASPQLFHVASWQSWVLAQTFTPSLP